MSLSGAKKILPSVLVALLLTAALPPVRSHAETVDELLDRAKSEFARQKPLAALKATQSALNQLWADSPLNLTQVLFTKNKAAGFGIYDPRPDSAFSPTDPLYVYLEPAAYGFQADGLLSRFGFAVDIAVLDAAGKERGVAKGFSHFDYISRVPNKEISLIFTVDPLKLAPGDYGLRITVHDKVKGTSVAKTLPFTILP